MRLLPIILLALFAGPAPAQPQEEDNLPQLVFEGSQEVRGLAQQLGELSPRRFEAAMRLVGLERAGDPIQILLATEDSPQANAVEPWVAGYAYGSLGQIVLFTERTPRYPDGSFEALLDHEVAHVLIARAAGDRRVPRWFNEGVAMVAGHAWGIADNSRLTLAVVTSSELSLREIDRLFAGSPGEVSRAYALSGALVRDLLRRFGRDPVSRILAGVRLGLPFEEALFRTTGVTLEELERSFWRRHSFWYRWVPLLGSSVTLWFGITLLALWAFRKRRQRDAEIRARWELEEELQSQRNSEALPNNVPPVN